MNRNKDFANDLDSPLNKELALVFSGDIPGERDSQVLLKKIQNQLKDRFYTELVFFLINVKISNPEDAKKIYFLLLDHQKYLYEKLKRKVSIESAYLNLIVNKDQKDFCNLFKKHLKLQHFFERHKLNDYLQSEVCRSKRYHIPLSVLYCRVNGKKAFESLGFQDIDLLWHEIFTVFKNTIRTTDALFRVGEEEFVCILPQTGIKTVMEVGKRILDNISTFLKVDKKIGKIYVSVGAAQYEPGKIDEVNILIAAAHIMMLEALKTEKSCVKYFSDEKYFCDVKKSRRNKKRKRREMIGRILSGGIAFGKAFIYKDILTKKLVLYPIVESEISHELERIRKAIQLVLKDLNKMKLRVRNDISNDHAEIFEVHELILKDEKLIRDLETELRRELINAEQAVKNVFKKWIRKIESSENEMLRNKAGDFKDISRKILKILLGYEKNELEKLPSNSIIVTKRLLPSDSVNIKRKHLKGIVTEEGSAQSHSALLAKALAIPAISNIERICDVIQKGDELILDGILGKVIINPVKSDKEEYQKKIKQIELEEASVLKNADKVARTRGGIRVRVMANASTLTDVKLAMDYSSDGIGLFRIEQIYLSTKTLPNEKFLFSHFSSILQHLNNKEVIMRLLDMGGDKNLPYIKMQEEFDPFLGLRGIRWLLRHENLLKTQLRALIKLGQHFPIKILIPMVTIPEEILRVRTIIDELICKMSRGKKGVFKKIPVGAMIETPAAVLKIEEIVKISDFISIGTNDLIQYIMCAGRENVSVAEYYEEGAELILGTIKKVVKTSEKYGISCGLCGEMAGNEKWTLKLLKCGLRNLSVFPHCIPKIKEIIRNLTL